MSTIHPLVVQLRFARSELVRCLEGVSAQEGLRRVGPMNCISWIVGHLANQENFYWVIVGQGQNAAPGLNERVGYGQPASTPPLDEMWATWRAVTAQADRFLDTLTVEQLLVYPQAEGKHWWETVGTMLQRNIYHYWFHTGEAHAIRQQLGHTDLPQFVGDLSAFAYRPEQVPHE
ncbi:MAG: DinB family protein [Thermoflexales bacterium]|nr:DinB family protein [Thermoflexales bacterium]